MIINHKYKFCFFAIPRTASTAISSVLISDLGSTQILKRHSSYKDFTQIASQDELRYYRFASIRNPLDSIVSAFFKKKTNHNGRFSRGYFKNGRKIGQKAMNEYHFIKNNNATFREYFIKFYTQPYSRPRHEHTIEQMDAIIRFENINEDYQIITNNLNIPYNELSIVNPTIARDKNYLDYYTEDIIPQALMVFTPIMQKWAYNFPEEWLKNHKPL